MIRGIFAALGLAILWLLMSGIYDKPLIHIFGVISIALSLYIIHLMDKVDGHKLGYDIGIFSTLKYICWLLVEIAKSNWAVSKIILSGKPPENQKLLYVPTTQKTELAQVVFANSITLTPGTITVETEGDCFLVHAVDFGEGDMEAFAEMDKQVRSIETS